MPERVRIGMYTIKMIISPNAADFLILVAAVVTSFSKFSEPLSLFGDKKLILNSIASITITDPSTTRPKSIAPRLIRLAETPKTSIHPKAKSIERGMTEAVISPARQFPIKSTSTNMTMIPPSKRFTATVLMVLFTRIDLSKKACISKPSGRLAFMLSTRCLTRLIT